MKILNNLNYTPEGIRARWRAGNDAGVANFIVAAGNHGQPLNLEMRASRETYRSHIETLVEIINDRTQVLTPDD